jgi:hypothetical protein
MYKLLSILLSIVLASSAVAQPRQEFMKLYNPRASNVAMNYMFAPSLEPDNDGVTEFDQHVFDFDIVLPLQLSQRSIFMFGAGYGMRFYDYSETPDGSVLEEDVEELHRLSVSPGLVHFLNRDTAFMAEASIGAYSNMEDGFKSDDMQYLGKALFVHHWRTNVQIIAGVGVTEDFDDNEFIPLLGFRSFHGPWHLSLTLPLEAIASYRWSNELTIFAGGWLSGAQYKVRSESAGEFDVQVRDTRVGAGLDYWVMPDVRFSFEAGALLGNDAFEVKVDGVDGTTEEDLENAGYARFSVGMRFN